jgi:hypothetical protein
VEYQGALRQGVRRLAPAKTTYLAILIKLKRAADVTLFYHPKLSPAKAGLEGTVRGVSSDG